MKSYFGVGLHVYLSFSIFDVIQISQLFKVDIKALHLSATLLYIS